MISLMSHADSRAAVFESLLAFLNRLDRAGAWYRLGHTRPDSVMVGIALPGWRWEVEFMADAAVEIERYRSVSGVEVQADLLDELFAGLEDR
jgi:hypothetical protein